MENSKDSEGFITLQEYAALKGVEPSTIRNRITDGSITAGSYYEDDFGDVMIRPDFADLDFEFYANEEHVRAEEERNEVRLGADSAEDKAKRDRDAMVAANRAKMAEYREARVDTEQLRARKLELEIASREARLLDAEKVRQRLHKLVQETKDALLNIPSRAAPVVLGMKTTLEVEQYLRKEIDETFSGISKLTEPWTG